MSVTATLAVELRRLTPGEKAVVADQLMREIEGELGLTDAQLVELDRRAAEVLKNPRKLRPLGDALRRLKR